jgi:4-amino-4-deoxy-L-arabinose transferase-like glycosyltransferase
MGGFGISDLNVPWDFWKDFKTNIDEGRMPSSQLLWWSRLPMAILAAMSIFAVLCLIKIMAGRGPAYIWVGLSLISSFFLLTLGRAMGESPLLASIVLIMLITNKLLQVSDNELKKPWLLYLYIVYLGVGIGLAESSKLNGISALAAGFLLSIIILFRKFQSRTLKIRFGLITILILIFTSQFTFFLINPYLWPDPLNREKTMFYHRVYEMINQQVKNPSVIIEGVVDHIEVDTTRIFQSYAAIHFNGFIFLNIFFFLIGISYILVKSFQY